MELRIQNFVTALRPLTLCLVGGIAAVSAAADVQQIAPHGKVTIQPAPPISTHNFFPKIYQPYRERPLVPDNPKPNLVRPLGEPNTLKPGWMTSTGPRLKMGKKFPGMSESGWYPPDVQAAVGPNDIVQVVNSSYAFFTKDGTKDLEQTFETLFAGVATSDFLFDPKVVYDQQADRFVIVVLELGFDGDGVVTESFVLLAVSDDSDPDGVWYRYRIDASLAGDPEDFWWDYPGIGYNKDGFIFTGNMFGNETFGFGGVQMYVLPKAPLLTGAAVTVTKFLETETFTVQPTRGLDSTDTAAYAISDFTATAVKIFKFTGLGGAPALTTGTVAVPASDSGLPGTFGYAPSTGGRNLDTIPVRMMDSAARDGRIVAAHTLKRSATDSRAMVRWYEINASGTPFSLVQSGNIVLGSGQHAYMPAITKNGQGDIAVAFTRSSTGISADLLVASRSSVLPLGQMILSETAMASSPPTAPPGSGGFYRWGDYFSMRVDPTDDATFWASGELFNDSGSWTTEIASFGGFLLLESGVNSVSTQMGTFVGGNTTAVKYEGGTIYEVQSSLIANLGQYAAIDMSFKTTADVGKVLDISGTVKAMITSTGSATGTIFLWNYRTKQYDFIKSFSLPKTLTSFTFKKSTNLTDYISSTGFMKIRMRAHDPFRKTGTQPTQFQLKADFAEIAVLQRV